MSSVAERFGIVSSALGLAYGTVESLRRLLKLRLKLSRQRPQQQESRHESISRDACIGWPEVEDFSGTSSDELRSDATTIVSEPDDRQFGLECCRQEVDLIVASQKTDPMTDDNAYPLRRKGTSRRQNGCFSVWPRFLRNDETFTTRPQPVSKVVLRKRDTRTSSKDGDSSVQKRLTGSACVGVGILKSHEKSE